MVIEGMNEKGGHLGRPFEIVKGMGGRYVAFNEDYKILNTVWPVNLIRIQDGNMVTLFLTDETRDKLNPCMCFKFQTPPWVK